MSRKLNRIIAQAGFVFGFTGGILNAAMGDIKWTLLCAASMTLCMVNMWLLREPEENEDGSK